MKVELIRFFKAFVISIIFIGLANLLIYHEFEVNFKLGVLIAVLYTAGLIAISKDKKNKIKKIF